MSEVKSLGLQAFEPQSFGELERLAERCVRSRMFGAVTVDTAVVQMVTAASLGLAPITGLRGIHVVQGKAVLSSDLLVAVVLRSGQCDLWRPVEITDTRVVIETRRKGHVEPIRHTWTIEMARRARLTGKGTWEAFPAAMLRARCSAELARMVYPDVLFGVYVEGEVDDAPVAQTAPEPAIEVAVERDPELLEALAAQVDRCDTIDALGALWTAAKADVAALDDRSAQERVWSLFKARARALGGTVKALQAAASAQPVAEPVAEGGAA